MTACLPVYVWLPAAYVLASVSASFGVAMFALIKGME